MNSESGPPNARGFPGYGLYLLLAVYTICFLDRQVINILAEPIKKDLGLTDAELGLLTGLSFAVFYTALGIPIARLSESRNRSRIIVACLAIWSSFTMLCALAGNMAWLLVTRIGVGFGEAGCFPASQSLISEYLPSTKRAWSLSILMMGVPLGLLLGMVIGGVVAQRYGWRGAFLAAGAPGLFLAALVRFLLPDPSRANHKAAQVSPPSFRITVGELAQHKGFPALIVGMSLAAFVTYAQNAFVASFFLRVYATDLAALTQNRGAVRYIGIALGLILGLGGAAGLLLGGSLGDRLGRANIRGYLTVASLACVLAAPLFLGVFGIRSLSLALALLLPATILSNMWAGPAYAVLQSMAHERSRATAAAIAVLFLTLIGLGLGPLSVGALSDHLARSVGTAEGLRWALMATAGMSVLSSAAFWFARRQMRPFGYKGACSE